MSQVNTTLAKAITSADGFHHLVYSISGTTHTLFLDGSAIAINTNGGNVFASYSNITNLFCGIAGDLSYGYTGYIDDFKIYNRALSSTDINTIFTANFVSAFVFYENFKTLVSYTKWNNLNFNGVGNGSAHVFQFSYGYAPDGGSPFPSTNAVNYTLTTNNATWAYSGTSTDSSIGYYQNEIIYKSGGDIGYWGCGSGNEAYMNDPNSNVFFVQTPGTGSTTINTTLSLPITGTYIVSFALSLTKQTNAGNITIRVTLGSTYVDIVTGNGSYTTNGNVSLSVYNTNGSSRNAATTAATGNSVISNLRNYMAFFTFTFNNISAGSNILQFSTSGLYGGYNISQISVYNKSPPNSYGIGN